MFHSRINFLVKFACELKNSSKQSSSRNAISEGERNHERVKNCEEGHVHVDVPGLHLGITYRRFVRPLYRRPIGSCLVLQKRLSRATYKVQLSQSEITVARTHTYAARRGDNKSELGRRCDGKMENAKNPIHLLALFVRTFPI